MASPPAPVRSATGCPSPRTSAMAQPGADPGRPAASRVPCRTPDPVIGSASWPWPQLPLSPDLRLSPGICDPLQPGQQEWGYGHGGLRAATPPAAQAARASGGTGTGAGRPHPRDACPPAPWQGGCGAGAGGTAASSRPDGSHRAIVFLKPAWASLIPGWSPSPTGVICRRSRLPSRVSSPRRGNPRTEHSEAGGQRF